VSALRVVELFCISYVSSVVSLLLPVLGLRIAMPRAARKVRREEFMFCDACGTAVQPGQAYCSKCGKQIVGPISFMQPRAGRVQSHVRFLGILWLALSAFNTIGGVALYIVANTVLVHRNALGGEEGPPAFLTPLLSTVAILLLAKAAFGFLAGWGLLQREHWARVLALVIGFISMFTNIPFGTALGIYTMWVLLPADSEQEYDTLAEARAA
jgi:predicted nucleic acid-binding Zn ribbon protein